MLAYVSYAPTLALIACILALAAVTLALIVEILVVTVPRLASCAVDACDKELMFVAAVTKLDTISIEPTTKFVPTYTLPAIPAPPLTRKAPVVVLVLVVLLANTNTPVLIAP